MISIAITNGIAPMITSLKLPNFQIPCTTYKLIQIGGVKSVVSIENY